jgi:hypothetical protein
MTLLSVGPSDSAQDEQVIGAGYQRFAGLLIAAAPLVLAEFVSTKWLIAICAALALAELHEAGGRLHDLCIRLRRTNLLLRTEKPE